MQARHPRDIPRWLRVLLPLLVAFMGACDDSTAPPECTSTGEPVAASAGLTPTFTWTPACEAVNFETVSFAVFDLTTGFALWSIEAQARRIRPPVTYGVVPTGVKELHAPEALLSGKQYGVFVVAVRGADTVKGTALTFTP